MMIDQSAFFLKKIKKSHAPTFLELMQTTARSLCRKKNPLTLTISIRLVQFFFLSNQRCFCVHVCSPHVGSHRHGNNNHNTPSPS